MNATYPTQKRLIPIGQFFCEPAITELIENVDRPSVNDIKQEAALRALLALRKLNCPVDIDPVTAFNGEPRIVAAIFGSGSDKSADSKPRWDRNDSGSCPGIIA